MPPQSRSKRRQQNERRQQQQPKQRGDTAPRGEHAVAHTTETIPLNADPDTNYSDLALPRAEASDTAAVVAPSMPAAKRASSTRAARRTRTRSAPEPVDYTKDYQAARRDLRWIAFWAVLLFAVMVVLRVTGIV